MTSAQGIAAFLAFLIVVFCLLWYLTPDDFGGG